MRTLIKSNLALIALFLLIVAIGFMVALPSQAHATTASKGAKVHTLKENVTYKKYDATGDRKADKVRIAATFGQYGVGEKIVVYINGKRAFSAKTYFYNVHAKLIQLKNGKCFMYLYAPLDNGDANICAIYRIKGGKLSRAIDLNKGFGRKAGNHTSGDVSKAIGNSLVVQFNIMAYMSSSTTATYTYKYKSGTLKKATKYGALKVGFSSAKKSYKAKKSITVYKSTKCSAKKFTIKKGQSVTFKKVYVKGNTVRYFVSCSGKSGWIKVADRYNSPLMHKYEYVKGLYFYEPPFEGLVLAG